MKLTPAQRAYLQSKAEIWRDLRKRENESATRYIREYERLAAKRFLSAADLDWIVSRFGLINLTEAERLGFTKVNPETLRQQLIENSVAMRNIASASLGRLRREGNKSGGNVVPFAKH